MIDFSQPVTAGTVLVRSAIQSPNFVSGAGGSGWSINQAGDVEFNSGVFRGTISAGIFDGTTFEINPSGAFFYNGTPALGNLVASISPNGGTDQYGNVYHAVISAGTQGGAYTRIGNTGIIHMQNAAGADVIQLDPTRSAFLLYSGAPALGNLVASIAATSGTDALGNTYLTGVTSYNSGTSTFSEMAGGSVLTGNITSGVPDTANAGFMQSQGPLTVLRSVVNASPSLVRDALRLTMAAGQTGQATGSANAPSLSVLADDLASAADLHASGSVVKTNNSGAPYTWQTVSTFGTNWSGSTTFNGLTTITPVRLHLDNEDNLWIIGGFKAGATLPSDPIFTLSGAYLINGSNVFDYIPCLKNVAGTVTFGMLRVGSNGNVDALSALNTSITAGAEYLVNGKVPLRNIG